MYESLALSGMELGIKCGRRTFDIDECFDVTN